MARRPSIMAMALWTAMALRAAAAQTSPAATSPKLSHDVVDTREQKRLLTLRDWNEVDSERPDEVIAVSLMEFPTGAVAEIRARFTRETPPRCVSWHAVLRDRSGTELSSAAERVVPDAFPLLTKPLPPNTYPPLAPLGYVLAHLGLGTVQPRTNFYFILPNGSLIEMDLWLDGRETVAVPAGKFDAYRVHMRAKAESVFPNLPGFLLPVMALFVPTQTVWLSVQEPQMLIKFTGQTGPPGSPQLLVQLTSAN